MSITLDGLNLTDLTNNGTFFEFREGHPTGLAEFRGADDVVPAASGRDPGQWIADSRTVRLYGTVIGAGANADAQQTSFRTRMDALLSAMDPASLVTIETSGEFGVASASLENCRPQRIVTEREFADLVWVGFLELLCIDSPPNWVIGS